jgi:hypothetical protein
MIKVDTPFHGGAPYLILATTMFTVDGYTAADGTSVTPAGDINYIAQGMAQAAYSNHQGTSVVISMASQIIMLDERIDAWVSWKYPDNKTRTANTQQWANIGYVKYLEINKIYNNIK